MNDGRTSPRRLKRHAASHCPSRADGARRRVWRRELKMFAKAVTLVY